MDKFSIEVFYIAFSKIVKMFKSYAQKELKKYNLSPNEVEVISCLDYKSTSSEIAREVNVSKALVSRSVKLLSKKNYIYVEPNPVDKSEFVIKLTDSGKEISDAIKRVKKNFAEKAFKEFGEEEFTVLKALINLIIINITKN